MNMRQSRWIWYITPILTVVLLFSSGASAAGPTPVFVRMKLPRGILYVYFKGEEMRIAPSIKTLKDAEVITSTQTKESTKGKYIYFPETILPIPEKALPFGATEMTVAFILQEATSKTYATIGLSLKDKEGSEWTYKWDATKKASKSPSNAPYIKLPDLKKLSLRVVTQGNSKQKKVGVGLRFKAGSTEITGVYKDGQEVKAHVGIINTKGEEVASEDGPISRYGFG